MLEQNEDGVVNPLEVGSVSPVETYICAGCGYAAWYAEVARGPVAIGHACVECGSLELAQAGELREEHGWTPIHVQFVNGQLDVAVCHACTRLRFTVQGVPFQMLAPADGVCRWCRTDRVQTPLLVHERAMFGRERTLPIAFHHRWFGEQRRGGFTLRMCRNCGDAEWHAERLQELSDDPPAGVKMLERKQAVGGPYR
jgi:hypothetical protein